MTKQRRCQHLRVHRQTVQHRVCLATGGSSVLQGIEDLASVYADCRGRRGHDLHTLRKTARSPSTVAACPLAQQSTETPKLLKGHRRRQHLAGETSLLGDYRSPTTVARVPVTS